MSTKQSKPAFPVQHQNHQPGIESEMNPLPIYDHPHLQGSDKLQGKVALITGGDSGIGRAIAVSYAKEGANVAIAYLSEEDDARTTQQAVEGYGSQCLLLSGDIRQECVCMQFVAEVISSFGKLDILVNNAAYQMPQKNLTDITQEQLQITFETNVYSMFYLTKAALPHLKQGATIINTTSITAYKGNEQLLDYSATKGAITSFTRSLSQNLVSQGIRVNGVAPGPVWTPLIPSTFPADQVATFGSTTPMGRAGQPVELAPAYVYLASEDSSYVTGQILHINGGEIVNG